MKRNKYGPRGAMDCPFEHFRGDVMAYGPLRYALDLSGDLWAVQCTLCGATGPWRGTKAAAKLAWNSRKETA